MADMAASVLARLKNKTRESGRSNQLCLQLFCQEEFLRRLMKSRYANQFVLKGGLFLYCLTEFDSRVTVDIDFLMKRIAAEPEELRKIVEEILWTDTGNDFVNFEIKEITKIAADKKYPGQRVSMVARIKNTRTPFDVDFGVGDIIVPGSKKRTLPTQLPEFEPPQVNTYSLETTVAEKTDAILKLMGFSSRMKDYYDLFYIADHFDFDGLVLSEALRRTFSNREHVFSMKQFEDVVQYDRDISMLKKWKAFLRKTAIEETDFSRILSMINVFLKEPLQAVIQDKKFEMHWSAHQKQWIEKRV